MHLPQATRSMASGCAGVDGRGALCGIFWKDWSDLHDTYCELMSKAVKVSVVLMRFSLKRLRACRVMLV